MRDSLLEALSNVPENQRAREARAAVKTALIDLANTFRDAGRYAGPRERDLYHVGINVCLALAHATPDRRDDRKDLLQIDRNAIALYSRHRARHVADDDLGEDIPRPIPSKAYDLGDDLSTNRAKRTLLDIVAKALVGLATRARSGRAITEREMKRALSKGEGCLPSPVANQARDIAATILVHLIDRADDVAPVLSQTPVTSASDLARIAAVVELLLREEMATTEQVALAVAYVFGLPWKDRRNFFSGKLLDTWAARRSSGR